MPAKYTSTIERSVHENKGEITVPSSGKLNYSRPSSSGMNPKLGHGIKHHDDIPDRCLLQDAIVAGAGGS
jgi:hypothetical protein